MTELKIELEELSLQDFFGQQNRNINKLRSCFPKLKIVARGNSIKAFGEEKYLKDHPELTQVLEMPGIVSGTDGLRKPDDSFRDILRNIKKKHSSNKNTMNKNSDF